MTEEIQQLLTEVDAFLARTGMAESTLGRKSVDDGKFIGRLREGKRAWPETLQRVRDFMTAYPTGSSNDHEEPPGREVA